MCCVCALSLTLASPGFLRSYQGQFKMISHPICNSDTLNLWLVLQRWGLAMLSRSCGEEEMKTKNRHPNTHTHTQKSSIKLITQSIHSLLAMSVFTQLPPPHRPTTWDRGQDSSSCSMLRAPLPLWEAPVTASIAWLLIKQQLGCWTFQPGTYRNQPDFFVVFFS